MSEFDFTQAEQEFFGGDELFAESQSMDDPDIARESSKARELNVVLHEMPISFAEAMSIQSELDRGVEQWVGSKVAVTGRILPEAKDGGGVIEPIIGSVMVDTKMLEFRGFTVLAEFGDDETEVAPGAKIYYVFSAPAGLFDEALNGKAAKKKVTAYGDLDGSFVDPRIITPERGLRWLQSVAPELLEEIDASLYNSSLHTGGEILALKGLDLEPYAKILDDKFTRDCVEQYIQSLINFDKSVPYSMGIDGDVHVKYGQLGTADLEIIQKGVIALPFGPYLEKHEDTEGYDKQWWFKVDALLYLPDETNEDVPPLVWFDAEQCKSIFPFRTIYYS